jgi:hypothetical protein
MDQKPHGIPLEGSMSFSSRSLVAPSLSNNQQLQRQTSTPEDVDSALRFTPLTSVVPVSGGTSLDNEKQDSSPFSVECIAFTPFCLSLRYKINRQSG